MRAAAQQKIAMREVRSAALGGVILLTYVALVLLTGKVGIGQFARLFATYLTGSFALWFMVGILGLIGQICWRARQSAKGGSFLAEYVRVSLMARWQRDRGVSLLWPPVLFAAMMASFNAFKQMVLPIAGHHFD